MVLCISEVLRIIKGQHLVTKKNERAVCFEKRQGCVLSKKMFWSKVLFDNLVAQNSYD